ncbi:MAG TPA: radical SAM protein [Sedimentisphaerales bacterium]|nr:radical SAM protein [Sedimentisphaerales bacterium]
MAERKNYLYGPVPSRRLGRSLGVDIVPFKVCSLDCIYCQLGRTLEKTVERRDYAPIESVLAELKQALAEHIEVDYISIAGSGEPTLHARLGELIDGMKEVTDIPIAIITNGTLLYRPDVRTDCAKADVVIPSLDAADEETFRRINCPCQGISIGKVISGLCAFREEFAGRIWLEVFVVEGINTGRDQIAGIREAIERIRPDKVQLNTAVRPTADPGVRRLDAETLHQIAALLGPRCEVVADLLPAHPQALIDKEPQSTPGPPAATSSTAQTLLSMLKRRPCSLNDIRASLGLSRDEVLKHLSDLQNQGLIQSENRGTGTFYKASP